jgi:hypothetical protein
MFLLLPSIHFDLNWTQSYKTFKAKLCAGKREKSMYVCVCVCVCVWLRDEMVGCKHVRCLSAVAPRLQTNSTDVSVSVHELLHTAAVTTRLIGTRAVEESSQNA